MFLINGNIFSTFERLTVSTLSALDFCLDFQYENDLKGKTFEKATREMLGKQGLIVFPESIEIFKPMLPKEIAFRLWGKEKNRTDIDVFAVKDNAILFIECKDSNFNQSLLRQGNKFRNYVIEQYYRIKWISENFQEFSSYISNQAENLEIDLSRKLFLFPLVVSNTLVNMDNFEGAPLITFSELKSLVNIKWEINAINPSSELQLEINGKSYLLPWFAIN
jgi:hypothetical protein